MRMKRLPDDSLLLSFPFLYWRLARDREGTNTAARAACIWFSYISAHKDNTLHRSVISHSGYWSLAAARTVIVNFEPFCYPGYIIERSGMINGRITTGRPPLLHERGHVWTIIWVPCPRFLNKHPQVVVELIKLVLGPFRS